MIQLRKANINDLPILEYWDTQEHVMESDPNDDWNWEVELQRDPEWREQLIAEIEGRPVGFVQIFDPAEEETHYWGDIGLGKRAIDIWIGNVEDLGKGYGTEMMRMALGRCFSNKWVNEVLIDPLETNNKAIRFYKKAGFQFVEKRQFGNDKCEVYSITLEVWLKQNTTERI